MQHTTHDIAIEQQPYKTKWHTKLVWTDITLSIFKETPVIPPLDYPYEKPVKRNFQKSFVFLCL